MTEYYREENKHLQHYVSSLKDKIDSEEQTRKRQQHEIKILGDMEREIRNKLMLLEDNMSRMGKKKVRNQISHQRSISNPEDGTPVAIEMKQTFNLYQAKTKSTENITSEFNQQKSEIKSKGILRSSRSYDNRRLNNAHIPIVPEKNKLVEPKKQFIPETHHLRKFNLSKSVAMSDRTRLQIERPQTSNGIYTQQLSTAVDYKLTRAKQVSPSPVSKSLSTGIASRKSGQIEREDRNDKRPIVTPGLAGALYAKKRSENAINPRDMAKWKRNTEPFQGRSTSAFGMYKTNPNSSPIVRVRNEQPRTRPAQTLNRRVPAYVEQVHTYHSVENLIEKRPLAKTNSTILNSNDFLIISLESRTVAQQIKLKELEKKYFNEDRVLNKTEWASFVSEFSETQKEVRNLDNEWQELFSELISHNSEYNEHMNKIRMWVTALKADSKFLQEIMAQNLGTPM